LQTLPQNHAPMGSEIEMILADWKIKELVITHQLISPFMAEKCLVHGVSYGLSAASYDLRLDKLDCIWLEGAINIDEFLLGCTLETVRMPSNVVGLIKDKSTWARKGLSVFNTLIDPGFEGQITLELKNQGADVIRLPQGVGIAQIMFFECDPVDNPYSGKYQGQEGIVRARD